MRIRADEEYLKRLTSLLDAAVWELRRDKLKNLKEGIERRSPHLNVVRALWGYFYHLTIKGIKQPELGRKLYWIYRKLESGSIYSKFIFSTLAHLLEIEHDLIEPEFIDASEFEDGEGRFVPSPYSEEEIEKYLQDFKRRGYIDRAFEFREDVIKQLKEGQRVRKSEAENVMFAYVRKS